MSIPSIQDLQQLTSDATDLSRSEEQRIASALELARLLPKYMMHLRGICSLAFCQKEAVSEITQD